MQRDLFFTTPKASSELQKAFGVIEMLIVQIIEKRFFLCDGDKLVQIQIAGYDRIDR